MLRPWPEHVFDLENPANLGRETPSIFLIHAFFSFFSFSLSLLSPHPLYHDSSLPSCGLSLLTSSQKLGGIEFLTNAAWFSTHPLLCLCNGRPWEDNLGLRGEGNVINEKKK